MINDHTVILGWHCIITRGFWELANFPMSLASPFYFLIDYCFCYHYQGSMAYVGAGFMTSRMVADSYQTSTVLSQMFRFNNKLALLQRKWFQNSHRVWLN